MLAPIEAPLRTRRIVGHTAMKNHLTRQHFSAATLALAAVLLAETIIAVPNARTAADAASADSNSYDIDILALNPKNE
jgi:hypothetical protein